MNILIVDDEEIIRTNVLNRLSRMNLRVDRMETAGSAAEARKKMEADSFELILCDIVMPDEDGISLAKWITERFPESKVVFLTAYADFSYMKEAISMQSFDYILQPVRSEELKSVVERAIAQIRIEAENRRLVRNGVYFEDKKSILLEDSCRRYLEGCPEDEPFFRELLLSEVGPSEPGGSYYPVQVQVLAQSSEWNDLPKELLKSIYLNIVSEVTADLRLRYLLLLNGPERNDFLLLFLLSPGAELPDIPRKMEDMRAVFSRVARLSAAFYCGIPCFFPEIGSICRRLRQDSLENVKKISRVYSLGQLASLDMSGCSLERELASWKNLIRQSRLQDFRKSIFNYLDFYTSGNEVNREYLLNIHQNISELILGFISNSDLNTSDVFDEKMSYYDFVYSWSTVDSLKKSLDCIIDRLCALLDAPGEDKVQNTIRYIRTHISEDISVSELAERVEMNPEYLTRLFKKVTGVGLKRYIINEKMETAKMLLTTTNLPVVIVADQVGYFSYSNFTRSFRLVTGCSPTEYQHRAALQGDPGPDT